MRATSRLSRWKTAGTPVWSRSIRDTRNQGRRLDEAIRTVGRALGRRLGRIVPLGMTEAVL